VLAIHNTDEKIQQRRDMLLGKQTSVCDSCCNIENNNPENISHRVRFSHRFRNDDFTKLDLSDTIVPKSIAIAFDSLCNFTCSYCDATQSSSWATDLKTNGPYRVLTDPKNSFSKLGKQQLLNQDDYDFLYSRTIEMISMNINKKITNINVLGGEPTMSPTFWKFFDWLLSQPVHNIELRVTTNLSHMKFVDKILENRKFFRNIVIQASIDGYGKNAEFTRYGLDWALFEKNLTKILNNNIEIQVELLGTVNILALDGLVEHLDWYKHLHKKFSKKISNMITYIKWPIFQSIMVLPEHIRQNYANNLTRWMEENQSQFQEDKHLLNDIDEIISLLQKGNTPANISNLQQDFKNFVIEYAKRRKLDIKSTLSTILSNWILEENHVKTI
jgi:hypothetical protein